jgi:hypothetical protein
MPGHIVRFKTEVIEVLYQVPRDQEPDARIETVIKAVQGTELCTIRFLPRHGAARPKEAACLHNKFAQIIELYDLTTVGQMRHSKSIRCHRMASYILLDNMPVME